MSSRKPKPTRSTTLLVASLLAAQVSLGAQSALLMCVPAPKSTTEPVFIVQSGAVTPGWSTAGSWYTTSQTVPAQPNATWGRELLEVRASRAYAGVELRSDLPLHRGFQEYVNIRILTSAAATLFTTIEREDGSIGRWIDIQSYMPPTQNLVPGKWHVIRVPIADMDGRSTPTLEPLRGVLLMASAPTTISIDHVALVAGLTLSAPLRFSVDGKVWSPWNAPINSAFDHTRNVDIRNSDAGHIVTAFTGERGDGAYTTGSGPCPSKSPDGLYGLGPYTLRFTLNGNYTGGGCDDESGDYLSYNDHQGIDFRAAFGTPVFAAADGDVAPSSQCTVGGTCTGDGVLTVRAKNGYAARYIHLSKALVGPGQEVVRGQLIGEVGYTGLADKAAAHLHFDVMDALGRRIDPYGWHGWYTDPMLTLQNILNTNHWAITR